MPRGTAQLVTVLVLGGLTIFATCASAQELAPLWGTSSTSILALNSFAFEPYDQPSNMMYTSFPANGIERFCPNASCTFVASVQLPTGAVVTAVELDALDTDPGAQVDADFAVCPALLPACIPLVTVGTGIAYIGGPILVPGTLTTPFTVNNQIETLVVEMRLGFANGICSFAGFRIVYGLQVSPAPGTATFGDVSTGHWAFQHIEALAASGITVGCTGSLYCPDRNLTRAEMAVFLSKALGLHWPN